MADIFRFKEFEIHQEKCAMKIGTDGVLLGAWASLAHQPASVLDIGAGTGVIALMMAQRSNAELIDALEIEPNAFEQCVENFERSPWGDRLFCYHAGFDEFVEEMDEDYDLIISNPPFFHENVQSPDAQRNRARSSASLPVDLLFAGVGQRLSDRGVFALIVPHDKQREVLASAKENGLYLQALTEVRGNPDAPVKRNLMQFGREKKDITLGELIIERGRHNYTEDYRRLTRDFYVKM